MLFETIVRAADYLPEPKEDSDPGSFQISRSEMILMGLFGGTPDYSKQKFENLWQKIMDAEDKDTIAYCLEKGVDVLDNDGKPVPGFRDIAVMFKAIEKGFLKLNKEV